MIGLGSDKNTFNGEAVSWSGQRVSGLSFSQTLVLDKCLPEGFHFNPIDDDDDGWESVYTQDLFSKLARF